MSRHRLRAVLILVAVVLLAAACANDEVASVGDETLTTGELEQFLADDAVAQAGGASLSADELDSLLGPSPGVVDKADAASMITRWITTEALYAELADRGVELDDAVLADTRDQMEAIAAVDPSIPDLDSAFGEFFVREQSALPLIDTYLLDTVGVEVQWPAQLCSSHILVGTEEEARDVIARLDAGEDFAALADELSLDTSPGGDLGCTDPSRFVPEFAEAAAAVEPPGISEPVESQFGWHVISVRSFDSAEPSTAQERFPYLQQTPEFSELVDAVFATDVDLDPAFGTWSPESFQVVPA